MKDTLFFDPKTAPLEFKNEIHKLVYEIKLSGKFINSSLNEEQWIFTSLQAHFGGLGIHKVNG